MGDHTETFQVDFDPDVITYADLLRLFWQSHNPARSAWSRQYRAVILYHDEAQRIAAERSRDALRAAGQAVNTAIAPLTRFYLAETYHQKYILQQTPLMARITAIYPAAPDWLNSTAAARLNGYLSGYGQAETFDQDILALGLTPDGERYLRQRVAGQRAPLTCPLPGK